MYSKKIIYTVISILVYYACVALHANESPSIEKQFQLFQKKYHKAYATPEIAAYRKKIFVDNLAKIKQHNSENHTYKLGINEYADQTLEEFSETHLLTPGWPFEFLTSNTKFDSVPNIPNSRSGDVDWRVHGVVTPVKNQGQCGSSWAFATTGLLEGAGAIQTGTLHSLSEQEFLDCNTSNAACYGGQMDNALSFAMNGITTEASYPYTAQQGICRSSSPIVTVNSYSQLPPSEASLVTAINEQPIAVGIQADSAEFQFYHSGIFTGSATCGTVLNHALLVVGYTSQYWIAKNSWGASWGSGGYIYIARGANVCGIANYMWKATVND